MFVRGVSFCCVLFTVQGVTIMLLFIIALSLLATILSFLMLCSEFKKKKRDKRLRELDPGDY